MNLRLATDLRIVANDVRLMAGLPRRGLHPGGHFVFVSRLIAREAAGVMHCSVSRSTDEAVEQWGRRGSRWTTPPSRTGRSSWRSVWRRPQSCGEWHVGRRQLPPGGREGRNPAGRRHVLRTPRPDVVDASPAVVAHRRRRVAPPLTQHSSHGDIREVPCPVLRWRGRLSAVGVVVAAFCNWPDGLRSARTQRAARSTCHGKPHYLVEFSERLA